MYFTFNVQILFPILKLSTYFIHNYISSISKPSNLCCNIGEMNTSSVEVKGFKKNKIANSFFIGGLCLTYKMQKTMGTHMSNKPTYLVFITHNRCIWHSNSLQNVIQILLNGDLRYLQSGN